MLNLAGRRVFLARAVVDMRKSYQTLSDVVRLQLDLDPLSGDVFIFVGRDRSRVKVLVWDASGFWICAKRLAGGCALQRARRRRSACGCDGVAAADHAGGRRGARGHGAAGGRTAAARVAQHPTLTSVWMMCPRFPMI